MSPTPPPTLYRLHATFHGDVQGIGFRYTVARLVALHFPRITGEITNHYDSTVHLLAEAPLDDLHRLLAAIQTSRLAPGITQITRAYAPLPRRRHTLFSPR